MKLTPQVLSLVHALAIVVLVCAGVFAAHQGMPPAYVPIIVWGIAALGGGHAAHAIAGALTRTGVVPAQLEPLVDALAADDAPAPPAPPPPAAPTPPPKPTPPPLPT